VSARAVWQSRETEILGMTYRLDRELFVQIVCDPAKYLCPKKRPRASRVPIA
jgi:hypothetical protein